MNGVIYKYRLTEVTQLHIGPSSQILTVGVQNDEIVLWAIVDKDEHPDGGIEIACINTGLDVDPETHQYIGSVTTSNGIVWHVFEVL